MPRFFCPPENISKEKIEIKDRKEIHHILNVLRLKKKDLVSIFDGKGNEYQALIEEIFPRKLILKIKEKKIIPPKEELEITIGCAIPKRKRFDLIVEKLTELGVKRIIPLKTERTEVILTKEREENKISHWQNIAISSAKQSRRIDIPLIEPQTEFSQILNKKREFQLCLICTFYPQARKIKEVLEELRPKSILVLIGPEGDFTNKEIDKAIKEGFIPVSLGDLVLRVETAAIAVASLLTLSTPEHRNTSAPVHQNTRTPEKGER